MDKQEQLIVSFRELFNKLTWLNKLKMEKSLGEYKASEVHFIEYIGCNAEANVTKLAEAFYMTRGAISKLAKKLTEKGIIESYRKPDNKKEIYFTLTSQGETVHKIHEDLHRKFRKRDKAVFEQITAEQFDSMLAFAQRYSDHLNSEIRQLDMDTKPE